MSDHTNSITWYEISFAVGDHQLPDAEAEVLVYDDQLDDVVLAHLNDIGIGIAWIEDSTGEPLPSPVYWAEKPFPAGV